MFKIYNLLLLFLLLSCKSPETVTIREYQPAEATIKDADTSTKILTVGRCTTIVERNNFEKTTYIKLFSAPDTTKSKKEEVKKERSKEDSHNFPDWILYLLAGMFALYFIGKIIETIFPRLKK